ncbi:hypothetical protein [Massilia phosphatilytica]
MTDAQVAETHGAAHVDDPFAAPLDAPMDFSQHFADAMATAQPAPAPVTNAPSTEPAPVEDDHTLDFDLGGLAFEPVETAPAPQAAQPLADVGDVGDVPDLEFDMSAFDQPTAAPAAPALPTEPAEAAVALDKAEHDPLDFSFDMDFAAPAANLGAATGSAHGRRLAGPGRRDRCRRRDRDGQPGARIRPARPADGTAGQPAGRAGTARRGRGA